jgi:hypothetical protein
VVEEREDVKAESHIVDKDYCCSRCNLDFKTLPAMSSKDFAEIYIGNHVGVLSGFKFSSPMVYLIRQPEHDSNRLCEPVISRQ